MSNSSLVSYTKWSPHYRSRGGNKISKITIHHTAMVNCSLPVLASAFIQPNRTSSSHYGIDSDGNIGQFVDEQYRAITSSSTANDNVAVTIEVMNCTGSPTWKVSDKAYESLIKLCIDICKRNNIELLNYTGNTSGNLTMHKWFAATGCPGPYLEPRFPEIAAKVNSGLGKITPIPEPVERKTLSRGMQGEDVRDMQEDFKEIGYFLNADGIFGLKTENVVKAFQSKQHLIADGIYGPKTDAALEKELAKLRQPHTVKVIVPILNIRSGPGSTGYAVVGKITDRGVYTIIDTKDNWGKLKSGAGWIYLPYTKKVTL